MRCVKLDRNGTPVVQSCSVEYDADAVADERIPCLFRAFEPMLRYSMWTTACSVLQVVIHGAVSFEALGVACFNARKITLAVVAHYRMLTRIEVNKLRPSI